MVFHFVTFVLMEDRYGIGQSSSVAITEQGHENLTPGLEPGPRFLE
jgi:Xaa-Pro aminopeptidase